MPFANCTSSRELQPKNVSLPISSTPDGMLTFRSDSHLSNALSPIATTVLGISTDTRLEHRLKAQLPSSRTPDGITTDVLVVLL